MNPNDIIVRSIVINIVVFLVGAFVIYMFCARLRDIADELRKFRIAFEMADDRRQPGGSHGKPIPDSPGNPFQEGGEERYKPESS